MFNTTRGKIRGIYCGAILLTGISLVFGAVGGTDDKSLAKEIETENKYVQLFDYDEQYVHLIDMQVVSDAETIRNYGGPIYQATIVCDGEVYTSIVSELEYFNNTVGQFVTVQINHNTGEFYIN